MFGYCFMGAVALRSCVMLNNTDAKKRPKTSSVSENGWLKEQQQRNRFHFETEEKK